VTAIAVVPEWVSDGAAWLGLLLAFFGLVGTLYGFSRWTGRTVSHAVRDIVVEEVAPIRDEVAGLRDELRTHVTEEARAEEAAVQWRDEITNSVRNLEQSQVPHLGRRASAPDPIGET